MTMAHANDSSADTSTHADRSAIGPQEQATPAIALNFGLVHLARRRSPICRRIGVWVKYLKSALIVFSGHRLGQFLREAEARGQRSDARNAKRLDARFGALKPWHGAECNQERGGNSAFRVFRTSA